MTKTMRIPEHVITAISIPLLSVSSVPKQVKMPVGKSEVNIGKISPNNNNDFAIERKKAASSQYAILVKYYSSLIRLFQHGVITNSGVFFIFSVLNRFDSTFLSTYLNGRSPSGWKDGSSPNVY